MSPRQNRPPERTGADLTAYWPSAGPDHWLGALSPSDRRWIWGSFGVLGAWGLVDLWRLSRHDQSTFSDMTRNVFRVDEPLGRSVFLTILFGSTAIFAKHILKPRTPSN